MLKTVRVEAGSELGRLLKDVAENDVLLELDGVQFRVNRVDAPAPASTPRRNRRLVPERVLEIIGIGASEHGSDIANRKHEYIADSADNRGE